MAANQDGKRDRKLAILERQLEALRLRAAGHSYDQIAEQLGYASRCGAYKAVRSVMNKMRQEGAEEARALELERLDQLLEGVWGKAIKGQEKAISAVLRISERRARLMGLDAPSRFEVENFLRTDEWAAIRDTIQRVLADYPPAAQAVAEALQELDQ